MPSPPLPPALAARVLPVVSTFAPTNGSRNATDSYGGNRQETIGVHVAEQGQVGAGARSRATGIMPEAHKDC